MIQKSILFLAAVLFLSACSSNFSLMKRRYTEGYYVSSAKGNATAPDKDDRKLPVRKPVADQPETMVVNAPAELITKPQTTEPSTGSAKPATSNKKSLSPRQFQKHQLKSEAIGIEKSTRPMDSKKEQQQEKATDSDVKLVVMVILCLFPFINLIPVYIHDNDITLNFLITLLLDFTIILGIIFALLVVLDVVDLR